MSNEIENLPSAELTIPYEEGLGLSDTCANHYLFMFSRADGSVAGFVKYDENDRLFFQGDAEESAVLFFNAFSSLLNDRLDKVRSDAVAEYIRSQQT